MEVIGALIFIAIFIFVIWLFVKILHKTGFSGWWVILALLPIVNIVMIWVFAFSDWPNLKKSRKQEPGVRIKS